MYLNRVELIGFLGGKPTLKSAGGKDVAKLSVATKTSYMKEGTRQGRTEWHSVDAWGKLGQYAATLTKGAHVRIEGSLRSREYVAGDGTKVLTIDIVAQSITNLRPGKRDKQEPEAPAPEETTEPAF